MTTKSATNMRDHARKVLAHQAALAGADTDPVPDHDAETGEIAVADPAFSNAATYETVRLVTVPPLPFPVGATYVLKVREPIRVSVVEDSKFGPARVCEVEAIDGSVRLLFAGEMLATAFARAYPEDTYVGRWFEVTKTGMRDGRKGKYADFAIREIKGPALASAAA